MSGIDIKDVFAFGSEGHGLYDMRFLTLQKLMIFAFESRGHIELYDVEDP